LNKTAPVIFNQISLQKQQIMEQKQKDDDYIDELEPLNENLTEEQKAIREKWME
jgi:hypothetical protein